MADGKDKDIVQEVFGRSTKDDDRVSAIFANIVYPSQVSLEKEEKAPSALEEAPVVTDKDSSTNKQSQPIKAVTAEIAPKRTTKNKELVHQIGTFVGAGLVIFVLVFFVGSYLGQHENDPTKILQAKQHVNHSQTVSSLAKQPLVNVQPEPVAEKSNKNIAVLDWQNAINWSRLLDGISAAIPKTIQLNVIESNDGSEMFLEGRACLLSLCPKPDCK